jgi:hypothetical protein
MSIVYRTDDVARWGAGKGSNLTPPEVDGNFWEMIQRLIALETNPPSAVSIDDITVAGNQMTIHLTDGSTRGPFTLPTAQWRWTGAWRTSTVYFVNDIFSFDGAIYRVAVSHTSDAATFDPNALGTSGYIYNLLLNPPVQPYDLGMLYGFAIPVDGSQLLQHVAARSFVVPGDFLQSVAFLRIAATTETLTFDLYKNDDVIGHLEFEPGANGTTDGGQFGTFVPLDPPDDIQFNSTDRFKVLAPDLTTPDATAAGLSVTIAARTGTIS